MMLLAALIAALQDPIAEAQAKLNKYSWEERLALGDWAKSKGLIADAAAHYRAVRDGIKQLHPYKTKAEKALSGAWKEKPDTATDAAREEHARRVAAYVRKAGDLAYAAHKAAKGAKKQDQADLWHGRTLEIDIDHPEARKDRGEARVDGFGWVPEKEAEAYRGAPQSAHFVIHTDGDARAALARLEKVRESFVALMGSRFAWPTEEKLGVIWLRNADAFEAVRRRVPGGAAADTPAFYSHLTRVAYGRVDLETLAHEVVHQLADVGAGARGSILLGAGSRADTPRDYWVIEGLAVYLTGGKPAPLPKDFDRDAFVKLDFVGFQKDPMRHYGLAASLFASFLEGPKKDAFLDFVRDFYGGRQDFAKLVK